MTRKTHPIGFMAAIVLLPAPVLREILTAVAWMNFGPIVDMRL